MATKTTASQPTIGKYLIYICQNENCGNREKEFAVTDRNFKYCSKCASISIKSDLCDSFKHVPPTVDAVDVTTEEDFDE